MLFILIMMTFLIFGAGIAAVVYVIPAHRKRQEKKAELRDAVLIPALNQVFDELYYSEDSFISDEVVRASRMVSGWEHIDGNDYISGWYDGFHIHMSDVTLTHAETRTRTDSKGNTETDTVTVTDFRGQWVIVNFDKTPASQLTLRAARLPRSGFFRALAGEELCVEMDSTVFNDCYTVLTDNPHDAFYLLTPHMMERILAANEWAEGHLSIEYLPWGEMHLAINSGHDFFEPHHIWRETDYAQEHNRVLEELRCIFGLIDQLCLGDSSSSSV
jgi:hypothetical protein